MVASMGEILSRISNNSSRKELPIASIFKVVQTDAEAKDEWKSVGEAMAILEASNLDHKRGSVDNVDQHISRVPIPPMYAATSSPWDIDYRVDTDDDEWLTLALLR